MLSRSELLAGLAVLEGVLVPGHAQYRMHLSILSVASHTVQSVRMA